MVNLNPILEFVLFPPKSINREKLFREIKGKTILITGASFGIGEALVHRLAGADVHLVLVARTTEKLEALKHEIEKAGTKVSIFSADLYKEEDVDRLVAFLLTIEGGIDVFVSNAGKSIRRLLFDSLDRYYDFTRTMAINYFAPVKICLALMPGLQKNQGQIINISSVSVLMVQAARWSAYEASKSAFDNWFRCALPELKARGIAASTLYLPLVKTRMIEPTESYKNAPAMKPEAVVILICRIMRSRNNKYKQWWVFYLQILSIIFRNIWETLSTSNIKKQVK